MSYWAKLVFGNKKVIAIVAIKIIEWIVCLDMIDISIKHGEWRMKKKLICVTMFPMQPKPVVNRTFATDIVEELKKVTWPSRKETIRLTAIVIAISLIIGFYVGIIDILLAKGLEIVTKFR